MSPAEAGAVELEEPNWRERFEEHCLRWPKLPRYLAEDSAFEATLRDWRRFFATSIEVQGKKGPELKHIAAKAADGMIALAKLGIFPPRNLIKDVPHSWETGYQQDEHMWLSVAGEQWRITAIEDRMLILERAFQDELETKQIDLAKAKWTKYVEAAVELLKTMISNDGPLECHDQGPD